VLSIPNGQQTEVLSANSGERQIYGVGAVPSFAEPGQPLLANMIVLITKYGHAAAAGCGPRKVSQSNFLAIAAKMS
jgi:hypothetical protein